MSHSKETVAVDSVKLRKFFEKNNLSIAEASEKVGRSKTYLSKKLVVPVGHMNEADVLLFDSIFGIDIKSDYSVSEMKEISDPVVGGKMSDIVIGEDAIDNFFDRLSTVIREAVAQGVKEGFN